MLFSMYQVGNSFNHPADDLFQENFAFRNSLEDGYALFIKPTVYTPFPL